MRVNFVLVVTLASLVTDPAATEVAAWVRSVRDALAPSLWPSRW